MRKGVWDSLVENNIFQKLSVFDEQRERRAKGSLTFTLNKFLVLKFLLFSENPKVSHSLLKHEKGLSLA